VRERLPCLPIDIVSVFDGDYVQPFSAGSAVEHAIGPDPVRPDLLFLKVAFVWLVVERVLGQVAEGFFASFSRGTATILEVFDGVRRKTNLPHCSSPNADVKE